MVSAFMNIASFYNELCKLLMLGIVFFDARFDVNKKLLNWKFSNSLWLLLSLVVGVIGCFFDNSIASVVNIILIIIVARLLSRKIKLRYPVLGVCVIALLDLFVVYGAMFLFGISAEELSNNSLLALVLNGVLTIVLFVIWLVKKLMGADRHNVFRLNIEKQTVGILIISAAISALIIAYVEKYSMQDDDPRAFFRNSVVVILSGLFFLTQCISIFFHSRSEELSRDVAQKEQLLESQKNYYMDLLDKEENTKRFRHDFKGHMNSIKALVDEGDYDKLREYLESVDGQMAKATIDFSTGNHMINSIISGIKASYPDANIEWRGRIPNEMQINSMDLCTIFYNLINNACREVSGTDNAVQVDVRIFNSNMFIVVRNKIKNKVTIENKHRIIKDFEEGHGYGLRNVEDVVHKYNGTFEITDENGMFDVDIAMPDVI